MPHSQLSPLYNVPLALDDSSAQNKGFGAEVARNRVANNAEEARERILGPMPINTFMNKFLREAESTASSRKMLSSRGAFTAVPKSAASVEDVHGPLLVALNKTTKHKTRCPGYTFVDMPFHPVRPPIAQSKRYIACYASENISAVSCSDLTPSVAVAHAEFFIDVNADPEDDYFADPPSTGPVSDFVLCPEDVEERKRVDRSIGYHLELVSELLARQHRVFAFTASVFGSRARLMRWDRAGCIASESFDLHSHSRLLCDFLDRYSQGSDAQRGFDTTIGAADEEEERLFKEAITQRVQHELNLSGEDLETAVRVHYVPGRVFAIHVIEEDPDTNATALRRFVVSRPIMSPTVLSGRCTRGFWAFDPSTNVVVFVKDTWRTPWVETEGAIISRLLATGVRNIPALVCHGEVRSQGRAQKTIADRHLQRTWVVPLHDPFARRTLSQQIHYRLVLGTVGYGLKHFRGTEELLHATYDAFQAMQDAYSKDRRIHRDISLGNVILVRDTDRAIRRGYLIDWEVSSQVDEEGLSLDHGRTGTWFYMSHRLQLIKGAIHTLKDDMDSLLWVVLYCALRWLPHNHPRRRLPGLIHALFEQCSIEEEGWAYGGDGKLVNIVSRSYTRKIRFGDAIHRWLTIVFDYRNPVQEPGRETPKPKWSDPGPLQKLWTRFLEKVPMPADDRFEHPFRSVDTHVRSTTTRFGPTLSESLSGLGSSGSMESGRSGKRKVESEDAESEGEGEVRRRKRMTTKADAVEPERVPAKRGAKGEAQGDAVEVVKVAGTRRRPARTQEARPAATKHRYSLRSPSGVVSKYRRVHTG